MLYDVYADMTVTSIALLLALWLLASPMSASTVSGVARAPVRLVLGTMTFAGQTKAADAAQQLSLFAAHPQPREACIDTARMYCHGATETMLGELLHGGGLPPLLVDSKANPFAGYDENLSPASVRRQLEATCQALRTDSVNVFYLHAPGKQAPRGR